MKRLCYVNCDELVGELVCQDKDCLIKKKTNKILKNE